MADKPYRVETVNIGPDREARVVLGPDGSHAYRVQPGKVVCELMPQSLADLLNEAFQQGVDSCPI